MNTSYPRKLADLARALVTSPGYCWPYISSLPVLRRTPMDLELPWFSFGAIDYLMRYVNAHHQIFEFGSGGSTLFFSRRAARILSMESHPEWHSRVCERARRLKLNNLVCELHRLDGNRLERYRDSSFFDRVRSNQWDVVVIDCFCGFTDGSYGQLRRHAFEISLPQIAPGGLLVLDDSWLFPELVKPRPGWEVHDFVGLGPFRYGVTSTAILRRLPD